MNNELIESAISEIRANYSHPGAIMRPREIRRLALLSASLERDELHMFSLNKGKKLLGIDLLGRGSLGILDLKVFRREMANCFFKRKASRIVLIRTYATEPSKTDLDRDADFIEDAAEICRYCDIEIEATVVVYNGKARLRSY